MPDVDLDDDDKPDQPQEGNPNAGHRPWLYTDKICPTCGLTLSQCFGHDY